MTYDQFFKKYNGQQVEREDSSNLNQCFDLAFAFCDENNIPRSSIRHLHADEIWNFASDETTKYFELIANSPTGVPQANDLVIWSKLVGPSGHVAIASGKGDTNTFTSLDQNWSSIQHAREVLHNYNGVLGWLRIKNLTPTPQPMPEEIDYKKMYKDEKKAHDTDNKNKDTEIDSLRKTIATQQVALDGHVADCDLKCQSVKDETTRHLLIDFDNKEAQYKARIKDLESQASTPLPAIEKPLELRYKGKSIAIKLDAILEIIKA